MSDKDRKKKDGQRKDKKNQAQRERENDRVQEARPRMQSKDQSNFTETEPGAAEVSGNNEGR